MNSEPLELALNDERLVLPWRGQSPRDLTRARKALFLKRERQKDERFFVDPRQFDLFEDARKGPPRYEGAPSLIPLKYERRVR